ncbi:hypothetical protein EG327_006564 [Venturia inaequalis]|uniref:Uncharacterized protein n=1 Tax=Venturia inaequalis TaxID=5025 RepID=A0A8H3YZX5_VENIN|nr:hypothetical protein EG327_006564 [Venturia inaequalis]
MSSSSDPSTSTGTNKRASTIIIEDAESNKRVKIADDVLEKLLESEFQQGANLSRLQKKLSLKATNLEKAQQELYAAKADFDKVRKEHARAKVTCEERTSAVTKIVLRELDALNKESKYIRVILKHETDLNSTWKLRYEELVRKIKAYESARDLLSMDKNILEGALVIAKVLEAQKGGEHSE